MLKRRLLGGAEALCFDQVRRFVLITVSQAYDKMSQI